MMELVKRLRENRGSTYTTDSTMRSIQISTPTTLDLEAAKAIEELCERLEGCWEAYEAAIATEREACAKVIDDMEEVVLLKSNLRILGPRHDGNLVGTGYAAAIRARQPLPSPPEVDNG